MAPPDQRLALAARPGLAPGQRQLGDTNMASNGLQNEFEQKPPTAPEFWLQAQKLRKLLVKELEKIRQDEDISNIPRHEWLEKVLAEFRSACVHAIFLDYDYATKHGIEDSLWVSHVFMHEEYRNSVEKAKAASLPVLKSKLEKPYVSFLKVSQDFYKGFIQRIASLFPIPELRVATKIFTPEIVRAVEQSKNVDPHLRRAVLHSCYMTLVHIGDLARYRLKARHKKPSFTPAQTFYELANDLCPNYGHAHHQIGIIILPEKKHFDIVYYFFRANAVERPHPKALENLDYQLRRLQTASAAGMTGQSGISDPTEPFKFWFVRLHALCYHGDAFVQHQELESEVLHRLEMAAKASDSALLLMKMVLVNIAAYHVACAKLKEQQTIEASTSSAYLLRFNLRYFATTMRLLQAELQSLLEDRALWDAKDPNNAGSDMPNTRRKTTIVELSVLPLVRLYASWLVACRADMKDAPPALRPAIDEACNLFAKCLTLLGDLYGNEGLKIAPFLLAEDHLGKGLLPLASVAVPSNCRLTYDHDNRVEKLPIDCYPGAKLDGYKEALARVLDILLCGYFLTEDSTLPFSVHANPGHSLMFLYGHGQGQDAPKAAAPVPEQPQPTRMNQGGAGQEHRDVTLRQRQRASIQQEPQQDPAQAQQISVQQQVPSGVKEATIPVDESRNSTTAVEAPKQRENCGERPHVEPPRTPGNRRIASRPSAAQPTVAAPRQTTQEEQTSTNDLEGVDVFGMVNQFLSPPRIRGDRSRPETSGVSLTGPGSPPKIPPKSAARPKHDGTFPGLPWDMVYTPTHRASGTGLTPPLNYGSSSSLSKDDSGIASQPRVSAAAANQATQLTQPAKVERQAANQPNNPFLLNQNSPWHDPKPARQPTQVQIHSVQDGSPYLRYQQTFSHQLSFPSSSNAFSQNSSLMQSTPYQQAAPPYFSAATGFGRGQMDGMNDPTHYKNMVRASAKATDEHVERYNELVLRTAQGDPPQPRKKQG